MSRRRLLVPLFALMLCLPSCFTTALWSTDECDDGFTSNELLGRVVLTPLTLGLDLLTLGAQAALSGDDDCERACERPQPCGSRRRR